MLDDAGAVHRAAAVPVGRGAFASCIGAAGRASPIQIERDPRAERRRSATATAKYVERENWLFLGRGYNYPVALEGALKLKEISYIHAEGMPAAEMKHGPIALIDDGMPVVFVATRNSQYEKVLSNIEEVRSRGGHVHRRGDRGRR